MKSLISFTGFPYFVAIINLPQRFQVVNGDSPIMAGVHLLPLLCSMAFGKTLSAAMLFLWPNITLGSFLGGAASSKKNFTSPSLVLATCLILLGCGLLSTLGGDREFYTPTYGYQFILGLGVGLTFSSGTLLTNLACNPEDVGKSFVFASYERTPAINLHIAAAQGALSQGRIFEGSIGLSTATIVLNNKLSNGLAGVLDPARIKSLEQSLNTISTLSPANQGFVAQIYTDAFNEQMRICTYLSAAALLAAVTTYQRNPASVAAMREKQNAVAEESSDEGTELSSTVGAKPVQPESEDRIASGVRNSCEKACYALWALGCTVTFGHGFKMTIHVYRNRDTRLKMTLPCLQHIVYSTSTEVELKSPRTRRLMNQRSFKRIV